MKAWNYNLSGTSVTSHYEESRRKSDAYRESQGLRKIERGIRQCLCCDVNFYSQDLRQNKLCVLCKSKEQE